MGAPNFRQALSRKCERFMGMKYDPETEMVVTIGSTEAMVDTIFALTNPGDKIVMFSPYFENYRAQTIMAGCEPVFGAARCRRRSASIPRCWRTPSVSIPRQF